MLPIIDAGPPGVPEAPCSIRAEAVAALHLLALRRQFDAIRMVLGENPPHRSREALWVALEVVMAELQGERIALRDLVTRAGGLLSGPTLSRVVTGLEEQSFLQSETAPDGRLKLLRPTAQTMEILIQRSSAAFAEFAAILKTAEQRLAETPQPAETELAE